METHLTVDALMEIMYHADYATTINMIQVYPRLNTDAFWEEKWRVMYPHDSYLPFITTQDAFLVKECKELVLVFDMVKQLYKNIIYENEKNLKQILEKYGTIKNPLFLPIQIKSQFIVVVRNHRDLFVFDYYDSFDDAENEIQKNWDPYLSFDIFDLDAFVFCFSDVNMEREENKNGYSFYRYSPGIFYSQVDKFWRYKTICKQYVVGYNKAKNAAV